MATSPSYAPDEDERTILTERALVAGDFITGVGYGIQLVLYASCAMYLFKQRKQRKTSLYILAYITLCLVIQTIFCAVEARTIEVLYVDNRNYPGGPWQYFLDTQSQAINVIFFATLFVVTFLSDVLVLWRCWVIWTPSGVVKAYLVTAFPAVMLLASFVMGALWTHQSSRPGESLYSALPLAYGTSYYAISLGANIILTILITTRLLLYRRTLIKILPAAHSTHYLSLAAVIVESAALYSVFALIFLITYAVDDPLNQIFLSFASFTQQISSYLIIYRLADGRAFRKDTIDIVTSNMNPGAETFPTMKFAARSDWTSADTYELPSSFALTSTVVSERS